MNSETLEIIKDSVDSDVYEDLQKIINNFEQKIKKSVNLILENDVDGSHHKQWVLTEVLRELLGQEKFDKMMKEYDDNEDYGGWDRGIAP